MKNIHVILLLFLFYACSSQPSEQLNQVENIIHDYPQVALNRLEKICADSLSQDDNACYGVLYAQARDKNSLSLFPVDSLLNSSFKYFRESNDQVYLAKALFYKNRCFQEMKEWEKAISCCYESIAILSSTKEYKQLCMLYADLGTIFNQQSLYVEAINMRKKSYEYATLCNDRSFQVILLDDIGKSLFFSGKSDSSLIYLHKALDIAVSRKDTDNISMCLNDLSVAYCELEHFGNAMRMLDASTPFITDSSQRKLYYLNKGQIFISTQQCDSARHYLNLAKDQDNIYSRASYSYSLYSLAKLTEDYKEANGYLEQYQEKLDSIEQIERTTDIRVVAHKHAYEMDNQRMKTEYKRRTRFYSLLSLLTLFAVISFHQYQNKKKKKKALFQQQQLEKMQDELKHINSLIEDKEAAISTLKADKEEAKNNISSYILQIDSCEKELFDFRERELELQKKLFFKTSIYKRIIVLGKQNISRKKDMKVLTCKERQNLDFLIKDIFGVFIHKLKAKCPSLTEEDLLFCCLSKLDFSIQLISLCFGITDTNSIRQRKYRIKKKLASNDESSVE